MDPIFAANETLGRFFDLTLPVDPIAIANQMGINVYYSDNLGKLTGFYDAKKKEFLIHEHKSSQSQRFSIAHEL
ncbi:MAG: hypothetical protein IJT59_07845 [Desulfovibrionaceae bacterium]|nr:hypothetical protein [Desulfovibrionaceae bacterium]